MLREAKLDGVIVLTSEKVNAAVAQAVLQVNLPVYLEKPPAISSPQLEDLIAAEKRSKTFVFAAFNRRHTPLFAGLDFKGEKPVRVSGALRRKNRVVATFPHTSIHLIDSAQYFGHSLFHHWKIAFERNHDHSIWTVSAKMEKRRRTVVWNWVPDGADFTEYLVVETKSKQWELQFPNTDASVPEGEWIVTSKDGGTPKAGPEDKRRSRRSKRWVFRPCLLDFVRQAQTREPSDRHRLASCRATIRVIEEMEACVRD